MSWIEMRSNAQELRNVLAGVFDYYRRGDVTLDARTSLLNLHCSTNGRFTDRLATLMRVLRPPRKPEPVSGYLGNFSVAQQKAIVDQIARDGYYVFEQRLPAELCDEMERLASSTPAIVEGRSRDPENRVVFDPGNPISKTYRLTESELVENRAIQKLMADPSLLSIAEQYLRFLPILNSINMWWSPAYGDKPGGDAAQEFHFDFDPPPIWLHFFMYLTDVGPENGPHVFVRGTHVSGHPKADTLLQRGYVRIPDEDIVNAFGCENVIELCGKRGTVLAVCTRGFHKGKMPTKGHRLIAQFIYSSSPFSGAHGRRIKVPDHVDPALASAIKNLRKVYERYR